MLAKIQSKCVRVKLWWERIFFRVFARPQDGLTYLEKVADFMCIRGMMMTAVNEQIRVGVVTRIRCKQWDCPDCAKINADLWQLRATFGAQSLIEAGMNIALVTVTAHERHSVNRAVEKLPSQWNKLRNKWQRSGEKAEYILIPEVGRRGHFHIHLLTTGTRGTRWWKDTARSCGFGWSNDESDPVCTGARVGFYVGKYLAKQLNNNIWKRGFHRVRTSKKWPKLPQLPPLDAVGFTPFREGTTVRAVVSELWGQGYSVALADEKASWHTLKTGELTEGSYWLTLNTPDNYA